ncbi:tyrosine-type recombinase/integrase [Deinococcus pimensis]|uniref:tyrosine-type recombinase/integrase n=1 Tax=Deinococcus pimensis TaxID=309888 RepID=UPI0004AD039F|nr:site-specific integrase [Deinococcus pimensis]
MTHPAPLTLNAPSAPLLLRDWLPRWLDIKQATLSPKTHANYTHLAHKHLLPLLGDHDLHTLTPTDLTRTYRRLSRAGYSNSLLHQIRVILRGALQDAHETGLTAHNPARSARAPRRSQPRRARALTPDELRVFLTTAAGERLEPLLHLAVLTGLRRGELCALRRAHLDLDAGILRVRENLTLAGRQPTLGSPKTAAGTRDVHLAHDTITLLRAHLQRQHAEHPQLREDGPVFTNQWGRRLHPDSLTKLATRLARAAGLGPLRFHDLRHTHASLMLARGVPVEVVSEKLGHSRPSVTLDLYRHVYREEHERHTPTLADLLTARLPAPQAQASDHNPPGMDETRVA